MKIKHASSVAERPVTGVITRQLFDNKVMYVGRRIRTASIKHQTVGKEIPKLSEIGYLIVHGDKPGLLIHEVRWDGKDIYQRGGRVGSLQALNSTKHKGYHAEIVDRHELIRRAQKFNRIVECKNVKTEETHRVALLNRNGDPYVAGIEVIKGKLVPINLEPKASYNDPKVQFEAYKDLKVAFHRFMTGKLS